MRKLVLSLMVALVAFSNCSAVVPPKIKKDEGFLRVQIKDGQAQTLQTAVVTYEKDGVQVNLVGAIHIGDRAYYRSLNQQMESYDALLYELVAPQGKIPDRKRGILGMVLKLTLELDSQVERIDYTKKNFVHADLSFEEMQKELAKNGDDLLVLSLRIIADLLQQKNLAEKKAKEDPVATAEAAALALELANAETPTATKRVLAKLLVKQIASGQNGLLHNLLIKDRNTKAIQVLEDQIKNGKKKLGIFYGAAHMADFETRLKALGYTRKGTLWLTAWDLNED